MFEIAVPFPTRSFKKLYHVGSLNASQKRRNSYEGAGLSVSLHPNEWRAIARGFVSGDTWVCTRANNQFVDAHKMRKAHRQMVAQWGVENGYVTIASKWRVSYYDDEFEGERYFEFSSREQAEEEAHDLGTEPQEIRGAMIATPLLQKRTLSRAEPVAVADLLLTVYVEDATPFDGVWWADRLDPVALSAPRGVIVPSRVSQWSFERLDAVMEGGMSDLRRGYERAERNAELLKRTPSSPAIEIPLRRLIPEKDDLASTSPPKVAEYAAMMQANPDRVEPIRVVSEGSRYRIIDGHHRYLAAKSIGRKSILAYVMA